MVGNFILYNIIISKILTYYLALSTAVNQKQMSNLKVWNLMPAAATFSLNDLNAVVYPEINCVKKTPIINSNPNRFIVAVL